MDIRYFRLLIDASLFSSIHSKELVRLKDFSPIYPFGIILEIFDKP